MPTDVLRCMNWSYFFQRSKACPIEVSPEESNKDANITQRRQEIMKRNLKAMTAIVLLTAVTLGLGAQAALAQKSGGIL